MYSKSVLREVPYQNQMQFNLGVPLTTQNLVTHFHQPSPIMIERIGGHSAIPGGVKQPVAGAGNLNVSSASSGNYTILSEDKMARLSHLAQRNLKNMKLRAQIREKNAGVTATVNPALQGRQKAASTTLCSRQRRDMTKKPKYSTRSKESARNRPVGDVQTPWPKRSASQTKTEGDSMISVSKDASAAKKEVFFPAQNTSQDKSNELPKGELGKVQVEIEESLNFLKQIGERAIAEGNTNFLQPPSRGKRKEGFLFEEEGMDRALLRSEEQNTRFTRSLYNMRQRVKRLQREATQADLNVPSQKRHIQNQLVVTYRAASGALQTFVGQLPFQDLTYGFPTHYSELNLLVQQLTALSAVVGQDTDLQGHNKILCLLDDLDGLNSKWSSQYLRGARQPFHKDRKSFVNKEWVSDTKVQPDLFSRMAPGIWPAHGQPQKAAQHRPPKKQQQQRGRPTKRASGKENKGAVRFQDKNMSSKTGMAAAVGQSQVGFVPVGQGKPQPAPSVAWEVNLGKSCMLPTDLIAQREKAQRAVELSNQNMATNFAQPTVSSRLRSSPHRPSSAPASHRRKEVNFDLDHKSLLPWIPAGSGPYRPRSSSLEQRSFSQRDLDVSNISQEALNLSPRTRSCKSSARERWDSGEYGFQSLPSHQRLKSLPVTDSFLDSVEHRLFDRMMQRRVAGAQSSTRHTDKMAQSVHERDTALDITDLYVEGDMSVDGTAKNDLVTRKAAGMMDAPTLENIKLRLADMERTEKEIRARWSTIKFADNQRVAQTADYESSSLPGVLSAEKNQHNHRKSAQRRDFDKSWSEDPLLFTKSFLNHRSHVTHATARPATMNQVRANPSKQLVSVKQTVVERILSDKDRYDSHLRRKSHHPSGKFDPWQLVEEISDEILMDCLRDVSEEVEKINEEIANHMYKSEFMVTSSPSADKLTSPQGEYFLAPTKNAFDPQITGAGDGYGETHSNLEAFIRSHSDVGQALGHVTTEDTRPVRATEPLLDDISHLMSRNNGESEEEAQSHRTKSTGTANLSVDKEKGDESGKEEEEDAYQEEEQDDDDYQDEEDEDDNYSDDDDFEDVSDVEL